MRTQPLINDNAGNSTWKVNGFGCLCMEADPLVYDPSTATTIAKTSTWSKIKTWASEFFNSKNFVW